MNTIFIDDGSENEPTSDSKLSSESSEDKSNSDDEFHADKDKGQLPPEHYIAEASSLDIS
ncbi:hypothetical protein N7462_010900 [Penicillium macrosclerotiorum]|uniref:uncharacterized protein n=1 Tax=Penicillium macrosclerotiorum TaxID=303699 RepID=UPI00254777AD|nr:uncharacterized protein N7462_010900 [Penicillium macrosclerotiorum]KAJ5669830.1 hypothetical protein N7462_010900 [Penicillium macrosclerotiorum]